MGRHFHRNLYGYYYGNFNDDYNNIYFYYNALYFKSIGIWLN